MNIEDKIYTEYSFDKGMLSKEEILKFLKKEKRNVVFITDFFNIHSFINYSEFFEEKDIKLILGCELLVKDFLFGNYINCNVTLIVKDNIGYLSLCDILNKSWFRYKENSNLFVTFKEIFDIRNIYLLSGGYGGIYTKINSNKKACIEITNFIKKKINDYYIEIQRFSIDSFKESVLLMEVSKNTKVPIIATHPVRYPYRRELTTFIQRRCILNKQYIHKANKKLYLYRRNYFLSTSQKKNLYRDCHSLITNFKNISRNCFISKKKIFDNKMVIYPNSDEELISRVNKIKKKTKFLTASKYSKRINKELNTIIKTGFSKYFLVTSDIVSWAKSNSIQVGPGRGSCSSSLVCYVLGITDVDPVKHSLIFERFLNIKKKSIPDFDIDFCKKKRKKVFEHINKKFGKKNVLNIVTFSKFLQKNTIRDLSRIYGYSYSFSNNLINIISTKKNSNLLDNDSKKLLEFSKKHEGKIKSIGTHAGGVIINNRNIPITILLNEKGYRLSQFDKSSIEKLKIVKFDILGLNTLSIISEITDRINYKVSFRNLNTCDDKVFELINSGNTIGIFQLEGHGIRNFLVKRNIKEFNDLVNIISIYRPGPLSFLKNYKSKRRKLLKIKHVDKILLKTNGMILFQEQIIKIVQKTAKYSLNKSDMFRISISKKNNDEIDKLKKNFVKASSESIGADKSIFLFKELKNMSGYSFNKAHAVSYSYITYVMALLKLYFKTDFYVCLLNNNYSKPERKRELLMDAFKNKTLIARPNINKSEMLFDSISNEIKFGLIGLKGIGSKAIKLIINERKKKGIFTSIYNFVSRFSPSEINKKYLFTLYYSGALDSLENTKKECFLKINESIKNRESILNYNDFKNVLFKKRTTKSKRNLIKEVFFERKTLEINFINYEKIFLILNHKIKKKNKNKISSSNLFIGFLINKKKPNNKEEYIFLFQSEKQKYVEFISLDFDFYKSINESDIAVLIYKTIRFSNRTKKFIKETHLFKFKQ
ncbi:DNA polymerase III subunit alpha [Candidatus Vidania fulgoroideorum]